MIVIILLHFADSFLCLACIPYDYQRMPSTLRSSQRNSPIAIIYAPLIVLNSCKSRCTNSNSSPDSLFLQETSISHSSRNNHLHFSVLLSTARGLRRFKAAILVHCFSPSSTSRGLRRFKADISVLCSYPRPPAGAQEDSRLQGYLSPLFPLN
jgi:hypothetical protein